MRTLLPISALLLLTAAPAPARDRAADLAALTPIPGAKAERCIPIAAIRESRVIDDNTIDFYMRGGDRIYRNRLPIRCAQLGFEQRFSYATSLSRLCSVDIITVLSNAGGRFQPSASCGLGEFQPMRKVGPGRPAR